MSETYPHYGVVRDFRTGCYEVARRDGPDQTLIVQTNIYSLDKAWAACDLWRQREREKHAEQH